MNIEKFAQYIYDKADDRHRQAIAQYGEYMHKRTPERDIPPMVVNRMIVAFSQIHYHEWWHAKVWFKENDLEAIENKTAAAVYRKLQAVEAVRS